MGATTLDDWGRPAEPPERRQPGAPHLYVEDRRPPNLWLLVAMTAISLLVAAVIMVLTLL